MKNEKKKVGSVFFLKFSIIDFKLTYLVNILQLVFFNSLLLLDKEYNM